MNGIIISGELLLGIALLYFGAEWLVRGGAALAAKLGVPPLIIGLTLVSFATSAPELVVSISAGLRGMGGIAAGNVIGSNICNIGLILGISALLAPLAVQRDLLRFDVPVLIAASLSLAGVIMVTGGVGRLCGGIFFMLLLGYIGVNVFFALRSRNAKIDDEVKEALDKPLGVAASLLLVALGLAALTGGGQSLVLGASALGRLAGMSEAVIGLTIVAIGTSLPELATSVLAALKHEHDIAIGNVVGSNIFNIFGIMGLAPLIKPVEAVGVTWIDLAVMLVLTVLLVPMMRTDWRVSRFEGGVLLALYAGYMCFIVSGIR
ncbi:MAG: calcium/sodium antiporter [Victivallaceae bacterium]|nr:calcium/sodium antiporter [Victivallaceae bacterium]